MKWKILFLLIFILSVSLPLVSADNLFISEGGNNEICIIAIPGFNTCFITGINATTISIGPLINILFPLEGGLYSGSSIVLNVTADQIISVWMHSINGGLTNTTFTPNTTVNFGSTGAQTISVFATNLQGLMGNSSVSFDFIFIPDEGFGISIFIFIIPALMLSFFCLFISGKIGRNLRIDQEEDFQDVGRMTGRGQWIPTIILLFSFIPMIFIIRIVFAYLEEFLPTANVTSFFGGFYIFFSWTFYGIFLISIIVLVAEFIKIRKFRMGVIDDLDG